MKFDSLSFDISNSSTQTDLYSSLANGIGTPRCWGFFLMGVNSINQTLLKCEVVDHGIYVDIIFKIGAEFEFSASGYS